MQRLRLVLILSLALLSACGGNPPREAGAPATVVSTKAADIAYRMVGKPYRYGGSSPRGFDCSGLVHYSYASAGREVARSTEALRDNSRKIARDDLRKGDLLFFDQEGKRSSHVGIYIGNDIFVHAPSSGKKVRRDRLADPYWRKHFVDARRL